MGKTVKELIKHLQERQEHLGVNAFHFKGILGNHDRVEPSKYPLEAQNVIRSGEGVQQFTSPPGDTLRTESALMDLKDVDKSRSPAAMSTALGHMTGSVKSPPKSPDISNPSAKDMDGQCISPLSPKILEEEQSNVMKKPPVQLVFPALNITIQKSSMLEKCNHPVPAHILIISQNSTIIFWSPIQIYPQFQ